MDDAEWGMSSSEGMGVTKGVEDTGWVTRNRVLGGLDEVAIEGVGATLVDCLTGTSVEFMSDTRRPTPAGGELSTVEEEEEEEETAERLKGGAETDAAEEEG